LQLLYFFVLCVATALFIIAARLGRARFALAIEKSAAVTRLLENDPIRVFIKILLQRENDPVALAHALRQNPYITRVEINVEGVAVDANFDLLLQEVAGRDNLEEATVIDRGWSDGGLPFARSRPILEHIQQNARITVVHLVNLRLSGNDVAAMLDNSPSISTILH